MTPVLFDLLDSETWAGDGAPLSPLPPPELVSFGSDSSYLLNVSSVPLHATHKLCGYVLIPLTGQEVSWPKPPTRRVYSMLGGIGRKNIV